MHSIFKLKLLPLYALILYHLTTNFIWVFLNTAPLPWDQAGHTRLAIEFADYFKSLGFLRIIDYFFISSYYPPLIHTIIGFLTLFFGHPIQIGEIVVTLFFGVSTVLVFTYALELLKNRQIAFLSAAVYSFSPIVFEHSRWFLLEIPLLTFVLASLICLERSQNFSNAKYTKLFFIFAIFAFLTKWLAVIYLFFPLILRIKKNSFNPSFFKYLGIFLIFTIPWYLFNIATFLPQAFPNLAGESSDPSKILTFQNFIFYIYLFINFQMTVYLAFLFFLGCIYFFIRTQTNHKILIGGSILFIYILFSFIPNKDWRYTLPIIPFASIIIASFLVYIKERFYLAGSLFIILIVLFLIVYHMLLSFRPSEFHYQKALKLPFVGWVDYVNINDNLARAYSNKTWPQEEILKSINSADRTWVLCLVDQERFNSGNLLLARDLLGLSKIEIDSPPNTIFKDDKEMEGFLSKFSYVLITKAQIINPATRNARNFFALKKAVEQEESGFIIFNSFTLPNGDILDVYKKAFE